MGIPCIWVDLIIHISKCRYISLSLSRAFPDVFNMLSTRYTCLYRENAIAIESEASDRNGGNVCFFQWRHVRHTATYVSADGVCALET